MNKYLIYEGGQPVYLNDLDFIQNASEDALKAVCTGFNLGEENILLNDPVSIGTSGANTVYSIAQNGYIVIGNEVYPIQPGSLTTSASEPVYWVVFREKYQDEILANDTEVKIYERRYVKLSAAYAKGDTYVNRADVKTFKDKMLATVADYLNETVTENNMAIQLYLNNIDNGLIILTYRAKRGGEETVSIDMVATGTEGCSINVNEVNGKRRLFTYDPLVKNISGVFRALLTYGDTPGIWSSMAVRLTFSNGDCYIDSSQGSPITQMPGRYISIQETIKI